MTDNDDQPLTHGEAARFIGVSVSTFKKLRAAGQGPESTRIGERERFRPSRLRKYLDTRTESGDE